MSPTRRTWKLQKAFWILRADPRSRAHLGVYRAPDQNQVERIVISSCSTIQSGAFSAAIVVTWDLKRIPFQPFVKVEYRQVQDRTFIGPLAWFPCDDFGDFLVGHKQKPIDVHPHDRRG